MLTYKNRECYRNWAPQASLPHGAQVAKQIMVSSGKGTMDGRKEGQSEVAKEELSLG